MNIVKLSISNYKYGYYENETNLYFSNMEKATIKFNEIIEENKDKIITNNNRMAVIESEQDILDKVMMIEIIDVL